MTTHLPPGPDFSAPDPDAKVSPEQQAQRKAWYWYDWANSAFVTTVGTVLIGPYLTAIAKADACPDLPADLICESSISVLGLKILPGSLVPFTVTASTIVSAILLVIVGAFADRHPRPSRLLGWFAFTGAAAATSLFFVSGTNWQLGVILLIIANICLGASAVVNDAILVYIAPPDDRDDVSSRGWAWGYMGGGILLAANLVLMMFHESIGMSQGMAVRINMMSAGIWWAVFTVIPVLGLRSVRGPIAHLEPGARIASGSFTQLAHTFRELRNYPQTLLFLLAYLFFNDGIQTVIGVSSLYGAEQLKLDTTQLMITILVVQFVAYVGARMFGALAMRIGAKRMILYGLVLWTVVVGIAYFLPERQFIMFLALGMLIGLVMGGTQALSRSLFSHLIPYGKEAEFFGLYQAMERGTSWFGTFIFGLVHQLTHDYRLSILFLVAFFAIGGVLLARVNLREGILAAGNSLPRVL